MTVTARATAGKPCGLRGPILTCSLFAPAAFRRTGGRLYRAYHAAHTQIDPPGARAGARHFPRPLEPGNRLGAGNLRANREEPAHRGVSETPHQEPAGAGGLCHAPRLTSLILVAARNNFSRQVLQYLPSLLAARYSSGSPF